MFKCVRSNSFFTTALVPLPRQVCSVQAPHRHLGRANTQNEGQPQLLAPFFSSIARSGCLHPFVFSVWLGLSPDFLAWRQHVLFGRSRLFCPDLPIEPRLNWGQQHLPNHLPHQQPAGNHLTCNPSEIERAVSENVGQAGELLSGGQT